MIYHIVFIICLGGAIASFFPRFKKYENRTLWILGTILTLLAGLRHNVGFDYGSYILMFNETPILGDLFSNWHVVNVEPGYLLLNSIIKTMGLPVNAVLFVIAAATMAILFLSFKKYSPFPVVVVLLYVARFFFVRDMGQIRSSIASAIILFSLDYIYRKQLFKFALTILVAMMFHQIAIVGVFLYFFNWLFKKGIPTKWIIGTIILAFLVGAMDIRGLVLMFEGFIPERFVQYLTHPFYVFSLGLLNPVLLMQTLILSAMLLFRNRINNKYFDIYLIAYGFSTAFLAAFNDFGTVAGRVSTVFTTFEVMIVPLFIEIFQNRSLKEELEFIRVTTSKKLSRFVPKLEYGFAAKLNLKNVMFAFVMFYGFVIYQLIFVRDVQAYFVPYRTVFNRGEVDIPMPHNPQVGLAGRLNVDVQLMNGAGDGAIRIGNASEGDSFILLGTYSNWWNVQTENSNGWIPENLGEFLILSGQTNSSVNFRTESSSESEIIASLPEGASFIFLRNRYGWWNVRIGEEVGWIHGDHGRLRTAVGKIAEPIDLKVEPDILSEIAMNLEPQSGFVFIKEVDGWWNIQVGEQKGWIPKENGVLLNMAGRIASGVNFRKGASNSHEIIRPLEADTEFIRLSVHNDWWQIRIGNEEGWIHGNHGELINLAGRVSSGVNFRTEPFNTSEVIRELEADTSFIFLGESAGWWNVQIGNQIGWLHGNHGELLHKD